MISLVCSIFFLLLFIHTQRTTDTDALELYNKKVRVVNTKTGDVIGYNYFPPAVGMNKVKDGGKLYKRARCAGCALQYTHSRAIITYFIISTTISTYS